MGNEEALSNDLSEAIHLLASMAETNVKLLKHMQKNGCSIPDVATHAKIDADIKKATAFASRVAKEQYGMDLTINDNQSKGKNNV